MLARLPFWKAPIHPFEPTIRTNRKLLGTRKPVLMELESRLTPAIGNAVPYLGAENHLVIVSQDLLDKTPQVEWANASVLALDTNQDVISQISAELANRSGLETIRIICHGNEGALYFGTQVVDQGVLEDRSAEIIGWEKAIAPGADLLLYGCSVAGSEAGRDFVATIADLTGADVAASVNPTGAGGDVVLEFQAGHVEATLQASQKAWQDSKLQLLNENGFNYISANGAIRITGYTGSGGAIAIPDTIASQPVTSIGDYAFYNCTSLTSVIIPTSVTSIGDSAFLGCANLASANIPNDVQVVGNFVFSNCSSLTGITIPNGVTNIGNYAFYNCSSLTGITIPNSVTAIGNNAFQNCLGLANVTIGNSVASIGDAVFSRCTSLISVTIPNSVTSIGNDAFQNCSALASITLGSSVTSIGNSAFQNCTALASITLGSSVTSIGNSAFAFCTNLGSVLLGNSISSIGNSAFAFCANLTSVTIPATVTTIGPLAFNGDSKLTAITVAAANPIYTSLDGILFNKGLTTLIQCPGSKSGTVTIPTTVTSIGDSAFAYCTGLTGVTIPKNIASIGSSAFVYCTGLTSITIPKSIVSIGDSAFRNCTGLVSATLGYSIPGLQESAFQGCVNLPGITVDAIPPVVSFSPIAPAIRIGLSQITISFSEAITGLDLSDLMLTRNGIEASLDGAILQGSGTSFSITNLANPTYPTGSYQLQLKSSGSGISDAVGHALESSSLAEWRMVGADNALVTIRSPNKDGSMQIREASSNRVLRTFTPFPGYQGAVHAVEGNFNGDGSNLVVMAAGEGGAPHIIMMDPATGQVTRSWFGYSTFFRGGLFIAVGDVNGDGADDLVTGPNAGGGPHIKVYDGKTNRVIFEFMAYAPTFTGGVSVSLADVNGDGRLDIVTGTGKGGGPHVRAFNALNGTNLLSFMAYNPNFRGGVFVTAGDMDGDGLAEIVTGTGSGGGPHVGLFDLRTRTMARGFFAYDPSVLNGVRVGLSDRNGDGILDIFTGPGPGMAPLVNVFDGRSMNLIDSFFAGAPDDLHGVHVS